MSTPRKGYTLIEVVAALSIFSVIFGTVVLTLYAIFKTSSGLAEAAETGAQHQRFAAQLRTDAHESLAATLAAPGNSAATPNLLTLSLADGRSIEYRLREDSVERRVCLGEAVTHYEAYRVAPRLDKGWMIDENRYAPLLTVYLHQQFSGVSETGPALQLSAALRIACGPASSTEASTSTSAAATAPSSIRPGG